LFNAMTRPLSAAVVAITIVVGLTVSYWFFLVGAVFYAFIVYSSLEDAQQSRQVLDEALYPERKLDMNKLTGPYRVALQKALDTRKRIETAVAQTDDPGVRKALEDSTGDMEELTGTIYDLALKAQSLQSSLQGSGIDIGGLQGDIMSLQNLVKNTTDEFAKSQYQATLDGKRQQLQNYQDTTEALNRWHAQLDNALSTLDTILSQVLRVRSSEVLSLSSATDQVSQSLHDQVNQLKATSDALDALYGQK
jgi:chromosome segregation ATPase